MVKSASSWLDEWLVIKRAFTNSHGPARSSNLSACRGFYISNRPLWFSIPMKNIVTYLMAPGRCPLEIEEVKSQGAPQRTAVHPPFLQGPVDK